MGIRLTCLTWKEGERVGCLGLGCSCLLRWGALVCCEKGCSRSEELGGARPFVGGDKSHLGEMEQLPPQLPLEETAHMSALPHSGVAHASQRTL